MANQSINNSKNAKPGLWPVKNITDQRMFKNNCVQKIATIFVFCQEPVQNLFDHSFQIFLFDFKIWFLISNLFDQTKYKETPIKINKIVQTGPKIQFGGLKNGFFKLVYHPVISEVV